MIRSFPSFFLFVKDKTGYKGVRLEITASSASNHEIFFFSSRYVIIYDIFHALFASKFFKRKNTKKKNKRKWKF